MDISLVVPAYNEQERILETLQSYAQYFPRIARKFELLVVVNGSLDRTLDVVLQFRKRNAFVRVLNIPQKVGKGGALIAGLQKARYSIVGFLDADDAFELPDLMPMLQQIGQGAIDVGIASKWKGRHFAAVDEPFSRKLLSRGWNLLVRMLLGLNFADTQAGAKFFSKEAWDAIPKDFIGRGFEFDIDLLSRFERHGLRIREFHIRNRHKEKSTFSLRHSFPMFAQLLRIAFRRKEQHPAYYYHAYRNWWHPTHWFYRPKIDRIVSFIPPKATVLDAGCGSGALLSVAAQKKDCKVTGIDYKKDQVLFARRLCPQGTFAQHDIRTLNLKKQFEVVNCSDVIEHFEDDERNAILARLDAHVQPGGRLILTFPTWFYISVFERVWKLLRRLLSPFTHFDDDDIHRVVEPEAVQGFYRQRGYGLIAKGSVYGLVAYLVFQKTRIGREIASSAARTGRGSPP